MTKRDALKLHNEDEVIIKSTDTPVYVIETQIEKIDNTEYVMLYCTDGNWYNHKEVY